MHRLEWANLKKTFAVLILAALIIAAFPILTFPNAKASASEAQVLTYSWYTAPAHPFLAAAQGDLVVVGEIKNIGGAIIQNVTLTANAYSASGTELGSSQGTAFVYECIPGAKAPFSIDFPASSSTTSNQNWVGSVASVTVTVLSVTDTTTAPYNGLTVPEEPYSFNNSGVLTTGGTIINSGSETVGYIWVVTTFYDNTGKVVDLNFTNYVNTPVAPLYQGHPTRWVATPADNTATITNEISNFTYVIDSMPYSSSSQNQNTPTPTPTAPGAAAQIPWVPIVVVVVIVVVAVVALMLLRKRPQKQQPPPPPPPPPPPTEEQPIS